MPEIILNTGKIVELDYEDWIIFNKEYWKESDSGSPNRIGLACRTANLLDIGFKHGSQQVFLHVEIAKRMGIFIVGIKTDHKDRNRLNCKRSNLRTATDSENSRNRSKAINNTSGFIGVSWHKSASKYRATIKIGPQRKHLGSFKTPEEAARCYDRAAKYFFKEYAVLNFLEELIHGTN